MYAYFFLSRDGRGCVPIPNPNRSDDHSAMSPARTRAPRAHTDVVAPPITPIRDRSHFPDRHVHNVVRSAHTQALPHSWTTSSQLQGPIAKLLSIWMMFHETPQWLARQKRLPHQPKIAKTVKCAGEMPLLSFRMFSRGLDRVMTAAIGLDDFCRPHV